MWIRRLFRHMLVQVLTALLGGLLGAGLVHFAPGFGVDKSRLDTRLGPASVSGQFRISIPLFILARSSLGVLGLSVAEPLPSWDNLRRLQNRSSVEANPGRLVPLLLLLIVISRFQLTLPTEEFAQ